MSRSKNSSGSKKGGRKSDSSANKAAAPSNFPKALLKAANERLRKLEKVSGLAEGNVMYQSMKNKMISKPKGQGIIFKTDKQGRGVRFISQREYNKLTPEQQAYYMARLEGFMGSSWSTAGGVKNIRSKISEKLKPQVEARRQSYETFRNRAEIQADMPDLTFAQYNALFDAYEKLRDVKGDHFKYEDLTFFLANIRVDALNPDQIEEAMSFVKNDNWGELIDRGWVQNF